MRADLFDTGADLLSRYPRPRVVLSFRPYAVRREAVSLDLPLFAPLDYVDLIEQEVGAPVTLISTGPRREDTIVRDHPALTRLSEGRLAKVVEQRERA